MLGNEEGHDYLLFFTRNQLIFNAHRGEIAYYDQNEKKQVIAHYRNDLG